MNDLELDAALAEQVLGWTDGPTKHDSMNPWKKDGKTVAWGDDGISTTGTGMLLVLEAMLERARSIRLHWNDVGKVWVAWFSDSPWAPQAAGDLYPDEASDVSLPRAVALAALEATT